MTQMEPFILFELAGTTYGVRSRFVQQIEMIDDVASVPNAHPAVEGVVLVRGQVIPALNLRTRFGFERIERDLRSRLVVINTGTQGGRARCRYGARVSEDFGGVDRAAA